MNDGRGFVHEAAVSETNEWFTPKWIFDALDIEFDLDPCGPEDLSLSNVPAKQTYSRLQDGWLRPWQGTIWLNPPYGNETGAWVEKLARHGNGIALVFNRTDTDWFQQWISKADLLCFLNGRIRFLRHGTEEVGTPGAGSVLAAWGEKSVQAVLRANLGFMTTTLKEGNNEAVVWEKTRQRTRTIIEEIDPTLPFWD